jgi:Tfp pilus assembly protein PilN
MRFSLKTPFQTGAGLDIGADAVRAVVLKKRFGRVSLAAWGKEALASGSGDAEIIKAIQKLADRLHLRRHPLVFSVEGKAVRLAQFTMPPLSHGERYRWLIEAFAKRFHGMATAARFYASYHPVRKDEKGLHVTAAFCTASVFEKRIDLMEQAGCLPSAAGAGILDLPSAFAAGEPDFFNETIVFARFSDEGAELAATEKGNPVWHWTGPQSDVEDALSNWRNEGKTLVRKIVIIGNPKDAFKKMDIEIVEGIPLSGIVSKRKPLPPEFSLAAGLALKSVYPLMNAIDFLPESCKASARLRTEKSRSLRFILGAGTAVLTLMIALNVLKAFLSLRLAGVEDDVLKSGDRIVQIETAKREFGGLERRMAATQKLGSKRSRYSELIQSVGMNVPKGVWLEVMEARPGENDPGGSSVQQRETVQIRGWAFDEEKAAAFLSHLENLPRLERPRLVKTERISGNEVLQLNGIRSIPLVRFWSAADLKYPVSGKE